MPSMGRKASKSSIARSPATKSPATPYREPEATTNTGEVLNRMLLSDATARFPYLISESPLIRILSGTETLSSNGHHARIWLSKNSLGSASLISGSLVSVALVAPGKQPLGIIPLYNFVEPNISHLGIDVGGSFLNEAGNYFAIASVLSSNKVQENEVKLSWSLSCTIGFPTIGQSLLISPIGDFLSCHNESCRNSTRHLHLHICKNLNLDLIPITSHDSLLSNNSSAKLASISSGNGNGNAESPQMPPFHSNLPSIVNTPLHLKNFNGSSLSINSSSCFDMARLNHILDNEDIRALYVKIAAIWLNGRYLLFGNIVSVSLCGMVLFSSVEGADELTSFSRHDPIFETKNNVILDEAERAISLDRKYTVLHVKAKTKIYPSVPTYTARESSIGRVFPGENAAEYVSGKEPNDIPRLGGLSKEYTDFEDMIKSSLAHKDPSPRQTGVLLHGPPGTGKTTLASYCIRKTGAELILINGQYHDQSEQSLTEKFDKARKSTPAVVFIDDLDAIAPAPSPGSDHKMAVSLSKLMDDIKKSNDIFVIAATNQPDNIDPSLRQHGRFGKTFEIGMPSADQRLDILHTLLDQIDHSLSNTEMESVSLETHGFVGADLASLCNEAARTALRRFISNEVNNDRHGSNIQGNYGEPIFDDLNCLSSNFSELTVSPESDWPESAQNIFENNTQYCSYDSYGEEKKVLLKVFAEDFEVSKKKVRPIAMREMMLNIPKVSWGDVGGQKEVKKQLMEAIVWPIKYPDAFKRNGAQPPRGLLMVGPPGCSKTLMARAVAWEAKLNFLAVKGPEIFCKFVGESEKAVRSIFEKAQARSPSIIFFDEMDSLARTRGVENDGTSVGERVLSQLLVEMDGLQQRKNVIVIAATNRPDMMDPALLRPGRFDRILVVEPPNESDREDIFQIHAGICSPDVDLKELARLTEGYTGADIKLLCSDAGLAAFNEYLEECDAGLAAFNESLENLQISMEHFRIGIQSMRPTEVGFCQKIAEWYRRSVGYGSS